MKLWERRWEEPELGGRGGGPSPAPDPLAVSVPVPAPVLVPAPALAPEPSLKRCSASPAPGQVPPLPGRASPSAAPPSASALRPACACACPCELFWDCDCDCDLFFWGALEAVLATFLLFEAAALAAPPLLPPAPRNPKHPKAIGDDKGFLVPRNSYPFLFLFFQFLLRIKNCVVSCPALRCTPCCSWYTAGVPPALRLPCPGVRPLPSLTGRWSSFFIH